ncbi:ribbon-helix-helix protein, CopG family [Jatrophihabitans sp.]|uniref:ribbon-helix-helix protein, CopG family n=1 Tax=Jatrophihabitans sp. TaxID=1932789 RepID=UPI0038CD6350
MSVSLPDEDVAALDEYARRQGFKSRSAAVHSRHPHAAPPRSRAELRRSLARVVPVGPPIGAHKFVGERPVDTQQASSRVK